MFSSEVALIKSNNEEVCYFSHSCAGIKLLHDAELEESWWMQRKVGLQKQQMKQEASHSAGIPSEGL